MLPVAFMTTNYAQADLDAVFGPDSTGSTPEQRAQTSKTIFVRSQLQLAFDTPAAQGRRLRAQEALHLFGWNTLLTVGHEESAPLL